MQQQPPADGPGAPGIINIPSPALPLPTLPSDRGLSSQEARGFAEGDLDKRAAETKHGRDERFRDHLSNARIGIFWLLVAAFVGMLIVLLLHWVTPWGFLTPAQLDTLKTIIGTAVASKLFADQAKHI
ncbi:hypothetical protein [Pseudomonas protegens]|uniref:hypothetical protein n=1 Tax=Pseudomonas protegens TaxID=380021 RepID=UPI001146A4D4|nr:hypothetical protein [Pseudomonas protegens]